MFCVIFLKFNNLEQNWPHDAVITLSICISKVLFQYIFSAVNMPLISSFSSLSQVSYLDMHFWICLGLNSLQEY